MKKRTTKLIAVLTLLTLLLVSSGFSTHAWDDTQSQIVDSQLQVPVIYYAQTGSCQELAPRMKYLNSVYSGLTIRDGRADCQGNYTTFQNVKVVLTVLLQRSVVNTTDNSYWSNVTGGKWSQTWTGSGQHILSQSKSGLSSGYYYRVETNATVMSGIQPLETVIVYSSVSYY